MTARSTTVSTERAMLMTGELLVRLQPWYDEEIAARVLSTNNHPTGTFGSALNSIRAIVVHVTVGWPQRLKGETFFERYTNGNAGPPKDPKKAGHGTQLYIAGDGSVRRVFELTGLTFHASHFNGRSVGVETGNTATDVRVQPPGSKGWEAASSDTVDFAGMKLWLTINNPDEYAPSWFTASGYTGPGFINLPAGLMLFSEAQYQSWALLARYLLELFHLPRNFPVLPHQREAESHDGVTAATAVRRIILNDQTSEMMKHKLTNPPFQFASTDFTNPTDFQRRYDAESVKATSKDRAFNRVWRKFTYTFRGVVGHHFCGNSGGADKAECPGKVFDFHRLAREVWDYWWYPFDVTGTGGTAAPPRPYRVFREGTSLIEYYWEESENQHKAQLTSGIHGTTGAPSTFDLDPVSPIYALANGELVAARFPTEPDGAFAPVSMAFVLVRHEIFHRNRLHANLFTSTSLPPPLSPALIDYNQKPDYVYSLYMHLGRTAQMNFDDFSDGNPDWLNRVLLRKKECQLGLSFYARDQQNHHITTRAWENRPAGTPLRPTTLESWRADHADLDAFLTILRSGEVAVPPRGRWNQPIRVVLGDFLGNSGIIRHASTSAPEYGIRVEVFSPSFTAPGFQHVTDQPNWNPPTGVPACVEFDSEWASAPDPAERARLEAIGVDPALIHWWPAVAVYQALDDSLPAEARLPLLPIFRTVIHYEPFSFMAWLNRHTWEHEWPKFGILDDLNNPIITPPAMPNSRRN